MQQVQGQQPKKSVRVRVIIFIIALLILISGAIIWALQSLNSLPGLFTTIFGALATIFSLMQLVPIIFQKSPEPAPPPHTGLTPQPINIYNVIHHPGEAQSSSIPANTIPDQPARTPPAPPAPISLPHDSLTLRALPLPTDTHSIQQRRAVVDEIYDRLIASDTSAVVLTGIGGIGKSTLASLVFNHVERERRAGRGPFRDEAVMLRINDNTTFLELVTNLFAALNRPMPDLASIPPQNQAFAVFNALNSTGMPRLIVLDQFESMLDQQSGRALTVHSGVGEFIDALNSQPCTCRLLLTSRPRPHGTRDDAPASLHIYPVGKLDPQEGAALLLSQGVTGSEPELYEAVRRCDGHALSLRLLNTLLHTYGISLTILLTDRAYAKLWKDHIAQNLLDRIFNGLPELSRQLLCAYSVYREAVPIEAVLAVVANTTKAQALTILGSLLNQHLVESQSTGGHYRLHPIVSDYAQNHFIENNETDNKQARQAAHEKAAQYYLQVATVHCPEPDKRRKVSDVEPLIEAVWQFCQAGQFQEAYELMEQEGLFNDLKLWGANTILLELCQLLISENWQYTPKQRGLIFNNLGGVYDDLGQKQEALEYYEQALRICREMGDRGREGTTLNNLGLVYDALGQKQEALQYYEQALRLRREVGDPFGEGITLHNMGIIFSDDGRNDVALAYILLAKALFERVQSPSDVDDEVRWIEGLHERLGKKQFAMLLTQVEPRVEQIVEEALSRHLGE